MKLSVSKLEAVKVVRAGEVQARCPACALDGRDKKGNHLKIFPDGSFSCVIGLSDKTHNLKILELCGSGEDSKTVFVARAQEEVPQNISIETYIDERDLVHLSPIYDYWNNRGISDAVLDIFRGGVSSRGKMNGRFCFPIFNQEGKIHGMTGRWIGQNKHDIIWKHIGETKNWVYPLFFNREFIIAKRAVILVESVGDMLSLWENGIKNVLILFGVNSSSALISKLVELDPLKIYISTNNDVRHLVGQTAAEKIYQKLSPFFDSDCLEIKLPPAKDFGECSKEQILKFKQEIPC